jgi:uncharacterized protein (DUF2164 family)
MDNRSTWAGLRWPFKAIIIALPLLLIGYFGNKYGWFTSLQSSINQTTTTNTTTDNNTSNTEYKPTGNEQPSGKQQNAVSGEHRTFAYAPAKPVNGELKGIVEVGATGFNSFVVNMDAAKNWEIVSKEFGQSFVYEGMATADDIRMGLKKYIASIFDKGVKSKNIHFVISSGAQKEPKTAGIVSELKKMGYVVNLVTAEQEGKLALKSVLPKSYQDNSFVVDIGSGNTKLSWLEGSSVIAKEAAGAKYYEKGITDAAATSEVTTMANMIPKAKREICFIIGGVPFELAKQTRQGNERFTVLQNPGSYKAGDKKKVACGLNIYNALASATGCDTFVFDWDANFSIGFLLSL